MQQEAFHFRLMTPLAVMVTIVLAIGVAAIPGPKVGVPLPLIGVWVIAALFRVVSRFLLKRRGQHISVSALWFVPMVGALLATPLLGAAALVALLFNMPGHDLLIHAEVLLVVWFLAIHITSTALFNLVALLHPAPANR